VTQIGKNIFLIIGIVLYQTVPSWSEDSVSSKESVVWQSDQFQSESSVENSSISMALESLKDIENLRINEFPGGAVLEGELLNPEDMRRVVLFSDSMDNVFNLCSFNREALEIAASHIGMILNQNQIIGLQLSPLGNALLLTGTPTGKDDVLKISRICNSLHIPLIDGTNSAIADPRMVLFEVSFVEINKDAFRQIGITWPASTSYSDPDGIRIGHLETTNAFEVMINHQVLEGNAKIISKPRLVCASGQMASFQAGGEIPVPRTDNEGNLSVTWKPYGIILQVAPSIDSKNIIHVQIRSEMSMVDHANAIEGIPGILTRKVETYLSLEKGQTVVLSGLVHSDDAVNIQKVPLLGDVPVFGELFRSHSFQKKETELVIFLTPMPTTDGSLVENKLQKNGPAAGHSH